jgi:hypothetical protein
MTMRNGSALKHGALAAALVLLGTSVGWAQTLTANASPSSGAAGVNNSTITGSAFPVGTITGATVSLAPTCAAAASATVAARVTSVATLRRFTFLIPGSLVPGTYKAWVSGTAGTTPFNTGGSSCANVTVTATVQGTASLGAAIAGATVTLVDFAGTVRTGTTASDGSFAFSTGGLTPPFLVKVVTATDSGEFPAGTTLYSVSALLNPSQRINVHVLTDLMVRSFYSAQGIDVNNAFNSPADFPPPSPSAVRALANLVIPSVQLWLNNAGVEATGDAPTGDAINLISTPFVAYPPGVTPPGGLDAVLHQITSEEISPDGSVEEVTIAGGGVTETISPVYGNGLITLNTETTNPSGGGTAGSFIGMALTSAVEPLVNGINATLAAFANTINTKGSALAIADLLPFYAPDYLHNGRNAEQDATETVDEIAGVTMTAELVGVLSVNNGVAHVIGSFQFTFGDEFFSGYDELMLTEVNGTWLLYGNQQVGGVHAGVQARRSQGGAGNLDGTFAFAGADAPAGIITGGTVTGPTNLPGVNIWRGANSTPLRRGLQSVKNGILEDSFFEISDQLGATIADVSAKVPPGSTFDFTVNTATLGVRHYTVRSNAITTEQVQFSGLEPSSALTELPGVLGRTINYNFNIPATYPISGMFLFGQVSDGVRSCGFGSSAEFNLDFVNHTGSRAITIPTNMAYCGFPLSTITFVSIFFQTEGVNGEDSIVQLGYPY